MAMLICPPEARDEFHGLHVLRIGLAVKTGQMKDVFSLTKKSCIFA